MLDSLKRGVIYLKLNFGKAKLLLAFGMDEKGYRRILGLKVAAKECDKTCYKFFATLKQRGLKGV